MKKGNVFITVFIFCKLDEERKCFLQVSLSSGDFMKKGNVFRTVFIFWKLDEKGKCFYRYLYLLET
jgi:hypothetical protein